MTPTNKFVRLFTAPLRNTVGEMAPVTWALWRAAAEIRHQILRNFLHGGSAEHASATVSAAYDKKIKD